MPVVASPDRPTGSGGRPGVAAQGHQVIAHARREPRAASSKAALPDAMAVVTGDPLPPGTG
jgi:hypothetical protein